MILQSSSPSEPSKSNLEIYKLDINDIRSTPVSNFPELGQHMQVEHPIFLFFLPLKPNVSWVEK